MNIEFIFGVTSRFIAGLVLTFFFSTAHGQSIHISHCMAGGPISADTSSDIVVRHLYVAKINHDNGLADWLAYRVLRESIGVASLLPRWWQRDELLPSVLILETDPNQPLYEQFDLGDAQDRDYRVTEVVFTPEDRVRLAPLTSFADTPFWEELNNLSNMSPLPSDLGAGAWSRLEQAINELAALEGELYIVSGPLFEALGSDLVNLRADSPVAPSGYFKVVATLTDYAAFIFASDLPIHAHYCEQIAEIDSIQELSGLTLFPNRENELLPGLFSALRCQYP
ncbi:MAG: hypothetical protein CMQ41_05735 [Gammaproteobacteria bacterium]|nr:hypothetical protein [Gammaproteobacteria bacterium]